MRIYRACASKESAYNKRTRTGSMVLSLDIVNTCMLTQYIDLLSTAHALYMLFLAAYAMCMSSLCIFATNTQHNGKCYAVIPPNR